MNSEHQLRLVNLEIFFNIFQYQAALKRKLDSGISPGDYKGFNLPLDLVSVRELCINFLSIRLNNRYIKSCDRNIF